MKYITITCVFRFRMPRQFYRRPLMSPVESFAYDLRKLARAAMDIDLKELKRKAEQAGKEKAGELERSGQP